MMRKVFLVELETKYEGSTVGGIFSKLDTIKERYKGTYELDDLNAADFKKANDCKFFVHKSKSHFGILITLCKVE